MRNATLEIKGINRKVNSSDNDAGYCSELINLRPENGLKVVPGKKKISKFLTYKRVITHKVSNQTNYIGFDTGDVVWFDKDSGDTLATLYISTGDIDNIFVATVNNMVVISDKNKVFNTSFIFINGKYEEFVSNNIFDIDIPITHEEETLTGLSSDLYSSEIAWPNRELDSDGEFKSHMIDLNSVYNKYFNEHKKYVFGYYLVGVNITLWDGNETRLSNLTPFIPERSPRDKTLSFTDNSPVSFYISSLKFNFSGLVKKHTIHINPIDLMQYVDFIKSINIYVSRPVPAMMFDEKHYKYSYNSLSTTPDANRYFANVNYVHIEESELESQLLYKYKSYTIDELAKGIDEVLEFSDDLVTNKTLEVDNGFTTRAGQMYAYNNRLHFYDTIVKTDLKNGSYIKNIGLLDDDTINAETYVFLRGNNNNHIVYAGQTELFYSDKLEPYFALLDYMTIVQDSRAYKLVFVYGDTYAEVNLKSSPAYNYSYNYLERVVFQIGDKYKNISASESYSETDTINVTAMSNPVYFPVEYSYKFNGNITAVSVATEAISDSQVGQYPINVFTDNGIFALEQGNGNVLYSNIVPLSTDTCDNKNVIAVKGGIVYIANNAVYLLSGRRAQKLSELLEGPIDMYIRNNSSFPKCCIDGLYDIEELLSNVDFREYIKNASLAWSSIENELIVSNKLYQYSYVYNFTYNCWYKVDGYFQSIANNILLRVLVETTITEGDTIVTDDLNKYIIEWANNYNSDDSQIVHLHTRPMHIQNQNAFKLIRKAAVHCLTELKDNQNLSLYIYGSNNLQDWKCISASQRKNCKIANIFTDRTAKAYKYFVFMIGGVVPANTELSKISATISDIANNKLR